MRTLLTSLLSVFALGAVDYSQLGANWADTAGNELCATGTRQSPIDLRDDDPTCGGDDLNLSLDSYVDYTSLEVENKGYTLQFNFPSAQNNGRMTRKFKTGGESEFEALQFHVHAPSENTINGQHMDLEIHFVHQYVGGGFGGVLAVMFDTEVGGGAENLFIE
jgi:carbonic anhydrase